MANFVHLDNTNLEYTTIQDNGNYSKISFRLFNNINEYNPIIILEQINKNLYIYQLPKEMEDLTIYKQIYIKNDNEENIYNIIEKILNNAQKIRNGDIYFYTTHSYTFEDLALPEGLPLD